MEFESSEDDQKEKLLKVQRIWSNKVNLSAFSEDIKISVIVLEEMDCWKRLQTQNPTPVPNGASPLAEKFKKNMLNT